MSGANVSPVGRNHQMTPIFKRAIPRRTFIQGAGATLALPLLDAMMPAFAAAEKPAKRFSIVYVPNGRIMDKWTPAKEGTGFELPPLLEPLAPFRDRLLVVTGLTLGIAKARPGEEVGVHESNRSPPAGDRGKEREAPEAEATQSRCPPSPVSICP